MSAPRTGAVTATRARASLDPHGAIPVITSRILSGPRERRAGAPAAARVEAQP